MKKITFLCLISVFVISCKKEATSDTTKEIAAIPFAELLDNYYEEGLQLNPLNATMAGDNRYNDQFPDILSPVYKANLKEYYESYKSQLSNYPDETLTDTEKLSKAILQWDCDVNLEGLTYKKDLMPIDQMWSLHLVFGQLASGASAQPFETVEDYKNWQTRVDQYLVWLSSAEKNMRQGIKEGYVLPKSLIQKVIPQMEALAKPDVSSNLFYTPVTNFPESISEEDQKTITEAYTTMIQDKIIPTYRKMADFLKNEYMEAGRESSGYSDLPNGSDYYNFAIKYFTTTTMTADDIHNLGLSEVARIRTEMEKIKEQVGFNGDLKAFFDFVRTKKELMLFLHPKKSLLTLIKCTLP